MNEHHYQRIDKGTTRQQKKDYRADARRQPRTQKGTFGLIHSPEKRSEAILDALNSLPSGETTDSIAARHAIPGSTLRTWLIADESNAADSARALFLSSELAIRASEIEQAPDPLTLARARESFRAWAWIAERRNARMFGQKQELTVFKADLGDRLRRAKERVIDSEAQEIKEVPHPSEGPNQTKESTG